MRHICYHLVSLCVSPWQNVVLKRPTVDRLFTDTVLITLLRVYICVCCNSARSSQETLEEYSLDEHEFEVQRWVCFAHGRRKTEGRVGKGLLYDLALRQVSLILL